jgi:hypothetical protein
VRAPHCREFVERRQLGIRIARDVQNGKVILQECISQAAERHGCENEVADGSARGQRHPVITPQIRASESEERLRQRQAEREDQCEMAKLGSHDCSD